MKPIIYAGCAALAAAALCRACGNSDSSYESLPGLDLPDLETELPCEVRFLQAHETRLTSATSDPQQIAELASALRQVRIGPERRLRTTDFDDFVTLVFPDGREHTLAFERYGLLVSGHVYDLAGADPLISILKRAIPEY